MFSFGHLARPKCNSLTDILSGFLSNLDKVFHAPFERDLLFFADLNTFFGMNCGRDNWAK